jgi:hypothetical protein
VNAALRPLPVIPTALVAAALAAAALARPLAASGDPARLARALDTIEVAELRADLFFFADPELRGRDTPSLEQRVAARFLRARLETLGLAPGAGASYFFEYPLERRRIDPERSRLSVRAAQGEFELVFGRDYFFPTSSDIAALEREGELVACGTGERADFERAAAVRGRWAVCRFSELSARRRARYAEEAGALGLIVLSDADGTDPAGAECARTTQWALAGLSDFQPRSETVFPQVYLARSAARRLLASAGFSSLPETGSAIPGRVRDVRLGSGPIALENVCALWPGSDPVLAREVLVVSAHYDHEGVRNGKVYPGADDNGSGSMGLLALAEALVELGPLRRSVLLMWVSGEEKGLWGSAAWTQAPLLPEGARVVANLNIDMIGRNAPDKLLITPTRALPHYNGLTRLAESLAPLEGFAPLGSADAYWERSDHANFAQNLRVPVAFLFSDVHADYHQPSDTADKLDYDKIRRVTRLVLRMLEGLQADELRL